ncbi:hypothetical protein [Bacillus sp. FSL K6-3431]
MQLGVLLGLIAIMGTVAVFLTLFIGSALNSDDAHTIDELPQNDLSQKAQ